MPDFKVNSPILSSKKHSVGLEFRFSSDLGKIFLSKTKMGNGKRWKDRNKIRNFSEDEMVTKKLKAIKHKYQTAELDWEEAFWLYESDEEE